MTHEDLIGKTIVDIYKEDDSLIFVAFTDGTVLETYQMGDSDFKPVKLPSMQSLTSYTAGQVAFCERLNLIPKGLYDEKIREKELLKLQIAKIDAEQLEENEFRTFKCLLAKYKDRLGLTESP